MSALPCASVQGERSRTVESAGARCCSTTPRSRATATRSDCCSPISGIDYERRELDVVDRSDRLQLLGELNPGLRVPTLVLDDGRPLAESNAILCYFAEGTPYMPEDRFARATGAAVAVLRAVQPRAVHRGRALLAARLADRPRAGAARREAARRLCRARRAGAPSAEPRVPRRRALHDRRYRAVRLHARRA